jgi:cold shock CspA family protein
MGRSQETSNKKEVRNKKEKNRKEKEKKRIERKENKGSKSLDDMIAYVDEFGRITDTPPDITKKLKVNIEDIEISVPKNKVSESTTAIRSGVVSFFNDSKGFGFIKDLNTQESIFVHINAILEPIKENNKVIFEVERGPKGLNAVNVKLDK